MLFTLRKQAEQAMSALDALMVEARDIVNALQYGPHKRRKSGFGEDFRQFRSYNPDSDRPQDIDWRQSAKSAQIFVREKEQQTSQHNMIWLDKNPGMNFRSDLAARSKLETGRIIAMALALLLAQSHEKIGLIGTTIKGHSEKALEQFGLHLLNDPPIQSFEAPHRTTLFMIGDFIEPLEEIEARLATLVPAIADGVVIQILDPAELTLPYDGRVVFHAPDQITGDDTEISHTGSIRQTYQNRIKRHNNAVKALCRKYGLHYIKHRSDRDITATLRHLQEALSHA